METINGVSIGDKFKYKKNFVCEVIDIIKQISIKDGNIVGYVCIAKVIDGLSTNSFDIPFSMVIRNKL